jgi:hypothetical protein
VTLLARVRTDAANDPRGLGRGWSLLALALALVCAGCSGGQDPSLATATSSSAASQPSGSTSRQRNCIAAPSECGFPDSTNTGVPTGVTLRDSGPLVVTTDGAVIQNLLINGCIEVRARNVTIRNVEMVSAWRDGFCLHVAEGASNTTVEDSVVRGLDAATQSVEYAVRDNGTGTRLIRVDIYWCTQCVQGASTTIIDSYIHDLATVPGAHYENVYDGGSAAGLTLEHNTLTNQHGQTAVIYLSPDAGPIRGVTIKRNLIAGGGYAIYGGADSERGPGEQVVVVGNRFSRLFFGQGGSYGTVAYFDMAGSGNQWAANVWDDTGDVVAPPG